MAPVSSTAWERRPWARVRPRPDSVSSSSSATAICRVTTASSAPSVWLGDRVDLSGDALSEGLELGQERVVARGEVDQSDAGAGPLSLQLGGMGRSSVHTKNVEGLGRQAMWRVAGRRASRADVRRASACCLVASSQSWTNSSAVAPAAHHWAPQPEGGDQRRGVVGDQRVGELPGRVRRATVAADVGRDQPEAGGRRGMEGFNTFRAIAAGFFTNPLLPARRSARR
jgi:hypothetical protein